MLFLRDPDNSIDTAECMFDYISMTLEDPTGIFFFPFDSTDDRYSSIASMLYTFLSQLISWCRTVGKEGQEVMQNGFECLPVYSDWVLDDLFTIFMSIILNSLSALKNPIITIILGNLTENVTSSAWLLQKLHRLISNCELNLRIIIISPDPAPLVSDFTATPIIDLKQYAGPGSTAEFSSSAEANGERIQADANSEIIEHHEEGQSLEALGGPQHIDFDIAKLLQMRPQLYKIHESLQSLFQAYNEDFNLRQMLVKSTTPHLGMPPIRAPRLISYPSPLNINNFFIF